MLGRSAQNLFWLSRYVERAENMARLLEVGYRMIRGHHDHDAVLVLGKHGKRGDGQGGCSVARARLENQAALLAAYAQLLGRREAMFFVADNDQLLGDGITGIEPIEPLRRRLQQRVCA